MISKTLEDKNREGVVCQACIWFERYEIKEILGEGGTGRVYLARDIRLGRPVAVKILEQVTAQFFEEVTILQKRALSMLPVIYDAWVEDDKTGVIIMEYVDGVNLKEYLALHRQISERQIYEWGLQLGGFLEKLHSGNPKILYRDLKTENIMVQPDRSLRLVDVGAAVRLHGESLYQKNRVGTFGYAAPEQWEGGQVDERADIYGLGAVLYDVMAGEEKERFRTAQMLSGQGRIPEGMVRILGRCLQTKKEKRYATAKAFLADWRRYRKVGRARRLLLQAEAPLRYALLNGAALILWHRQDHLLLAWSFLAGYVWLKAAMWFCGRRSERWEQKKSVWCRGA